MGRLNVDGTEIQVLQIKEDDYISLTDIVRKIDNGPALIEKRLRNKNTIEFLGIWEEMYNENFVDNYDKLFPEGKSGYNNLEEVINQSERNIGKIEAEYKRQTVKKNKAAAQFDLISQPYGSPSCC
jgi:hypothetical protein